jgi:hypothetical protein
MEKSVSAPTYRRLPKDPTEAAERKTTLLKKSSLPEEVVWQLRPQGSRPPRLYKLPKIHKEGVPLRPIVSTIGAPTYRLAQHLAGLLGAHIGGSPHHVRNSVELINTLRAGPRDINTLRAGPRDIFVSCDVVSLCTMVPVEEALTAPSEPAL